MSPFLESAIEYSLSEVSRTGDPSKLPRPLYVVVLVHAAQGTINNGGLQYFFESDFPSNPPYAEFITAYQEIGATAEAKLLQKAVDLFPFKDPHRHADKRNKYLDKFKDEEGDTVKSPFDPLTKKLCGNENVWKCLESYVRKFKSSFEGP